MIFKVTYQENKDQVPKREATQSLYIEAEDRVEAIDKLTKNTEYNLEFVQELDSAHLAYEQEHNPDFKLVEF
ncbi:DNA-dependent RNA polymerase auxiliary subunit epsilon family protein [Facklamia sp. DSM 111018]|uniref:DNA-directed RNA polymerase subunit epsilon n=1 Tax=Facklamia lactis TaxID=2749967 RepID=A0ABS0LRN6_9LACT|nr:DNA-directed RNA polymerase subunit epsilon [Facklamia lactis]MBG9980973.1 DNA-dependent RNA polymerase auxiliary subunit epsilon family protein [Facklamia lactis]MBG9986664.1 DNA-dependent RNA polymerase auxiliary subunit epsilon family protein [Facklamia lactis]